MTEAQFEELEKRIEKRLEELNRKDWQWWTQMITTAALALVTSILVPWGTWVTKKIHESETRLQSFEDWKTYRSQAIPVDAKSMKYEILAESAQQFGAEIGKLSGKIDALQIQVFDVRAAIQAHIAPSNGIK